jgi:hypothetical protein
VVLNLGATEEPRRYGIARDRKANREGKMFGALFVPEQRISETDIEPPFVPN